MSANRANAILIRVEQAIEALAALLTGVSAILIFVGVVLRNLFSVSPSWVVEAPIYTFCWAVFLVLGGTFQRGLHLGLDIMIAGLPPQAQRFFAAFCTLAMGVIAGLLMWLGADLVIEQFKIGATSNTALKMPLYMVTAAMPIGFAFLLVRAVADLIARKYRDAPTITSSEASL